MKGIAYYIPACTGVLVIFSWATIGKTSGDNSVAGLKLGGLYLGEDYTQIREELGLKSGTNEPFEPNYYPTISDRQRKIYVHLDEQCRADRIEGTILTKDDKVVAKVGYRLDSHWNFGIKHIGINNFLLGPARIFVAEDGVVTGLMLGKPPEGLVP